MSDESKEKDDGLGCILMIIVMLFMMHCCTSLSNLESDMQEQLNRHRCFEY